MNAPCERVAPAGAAPAEVVAWHGDRREARDDWLAEEVPVAIVVDGVSHAVMLASPVDLEDFALGFALTEGLIDARADLFGVETVEVADGVELRLEVASRCAWRLRERRRTMAGRTGCGLCGVDSLAQVRRPLEPVRAVRVPATSLAAAQRALSSRQSLQRLTGSTHAAAWCAPDGAVSIVREDVGRHTALDKLVGAMVRAGVDPSAGFVCLTSRASFEMVQKAAAAGIGVVAAVSAPTSLAVRTAESLNVLLAGFVRGDAGVAYTFPDRLTAHDDGR